MRFSTMPGYCSIPDSLRGTGPRLLCTSLAVLLTLLFATPARADDRARAVEAYKEAQASYDLGEYAKAVAGYKEAYRLSKKPELLFNIAQALRLAGQHREALGRYRSYLRALPNASNRADVEGFIAQLEAKVAEEDAAAKRREQERRAREQQKLEAMRAESEQRAKERAFKLEQARADAQRQRRLRTAAYITGGSGIVVAGLGAVLSFTASSKWDDINQLADDRGSWSTDYADKYSSAERDETLGVIGMGIGGAAVVAGGLLFVLSSGGADEEPPVAIVPTGQGAQVVWQW